MARILCLVGWIYSLLWNISMDKQNVLFKVPNWISCMIQMCFTSIHIKSINLIVILIKIQNFSLRKCIWNIMCEMAAISHMIFQMHFLNDRLGGELSLFLPCAIILMTPNANVWYQLLYKMVFSSSIKTYITFINDLIHSSVWLCFICQAMALQWRHNGYAGISNHQPHDCLLNRLFGHRSKKPSKLCVTGLCVGNSPGTGEFPAQMASNAENVSIWWCDHGLCPPGIHYWDYYPGALSFCQKFYATYLKFTTHTFHLCVLDHQMIAET